MQPALDWSRASTWEFLPLDEEAFPAVRLARAAGEAGGVVPALYNAANEEAVAAFVANRLSFRGIVDLVATGRTLEENDLEVREEIVECTARFVANRVAHKLRTGEIDDLTARLREATAR